MLSILKERRASTAIIIRKMSSPHEKEVDVTRNESSSEDKIQTHHVDGSAPVVALPTARKFEAPEFIRNMSPDERLSIESSLKRKIDLRLMPMIVIMYVHFLTLNIRPRTLLLIQNSLLGT